MIFPTPYVPFPIIDNPGPPLSLEEVLPMLFIGFTTFLIVIVVIRLIWALINKK